jgi:hypothetical protein
VYGERRKYVLWFLMSVVERYVLYAGRFKQSEIAYSNYWFITTPYNTAVFYRKTLSYWEQATGFETKTTIMRLCVKIWKKEMFYCIFILDGPGIESRWKRDFPHSTRPALGPTQTPVQRVPSLSRG